MAYLTKPKMSNGGICPCCGQNTQYLRFGVKIYPQTCRVLDLIVAAGPSGIDSHSILKNAYKGIRGSGIKLVQAHVRLARRSLHGTGVFIRVRRTKNGWFFYYISKEVRTVSLHAD